MRVDVDWDREGYQSFSFREWVVKEYVYGYTLQNLEDRISGFFKYVNSEVDRLGVDRDQIDVHVNDNTYDGIFDINISFHYPYTRETLLEAMREELDACDKNQKEEEEGHRVRMANYDYQRAKWEQRRAEWQD